MQEENRQKGGQPECGFYIICQAEYAEYAEYALAAGGGQGRNPAWSQTTTLRLLRARVG